MRERAGARRVCERGLGPGAFASVGSGGERPALRAHQRIDLELPIHRRGRDALVRPDRAGRVRRAGHRTRVEGGTAGRARRGVGSQGTWERLAVLVDGGGDKGELPGRGLCAARQLDAQPRRQNPHGERLQPWCERGDQRRPPRRGRGGGGKGGGGGGGGTHLGGAVKGVGEQCDRHGGGGVAAHQRRRDAPRPAEDGGDRDE